MTDKKKEFTSDIAEDDKTIVKMLVPSKSITNQLRNILMNEFGLSKSMINDLIIDEIKRQVQQFITSENFQSGLSAVIDRRVVHLMEEQYGQGPKFKDHIIAAIKDDAKKIFEEHFEVKITKKEKE